MPEPRNDPAAKTVIAPRAAEGATVTANAQANTLAVTDESPYLYVQVGGKLGAFEIERRLGAGGMGEVFAARKGEGPLVALKVLSDVHAARLYRFKREFRALADTKHDNLIALDELVVLPNGQAFFTMELVEGVEFNEYVRGDLMQGQPPNLVRLERVLRQLVDGVHHLHLGRCVHRDLKPSNVLVTREGRVVILDFGVISEQSEDEGMTRDGQMMGTPAYMAPEQAGGQVTGPPADFYAIASMLFECLTGILPFRGPVLDILLTKRHKDPPDPVAHLDPTITRDARLDGLIALCRAGMAVEPSERPDFAAFVAQLGEYRPESGGRPASRRGPIVSVAGAGERAREVFVGRTRELAVLEDAFERVQSELGPVAVHIRGPSGQGKSALVSHFLARARARGEVVSLRGRCLERESVPYKGIDAVVDALSLYLRRLTPIEQARLQPRHIAPLLQLFPVLAGAWPDGARLINLDPGELRRRGFAALREVLARVGESKPLVIDVDDFQWADVDSARLVTELMRPPDPPAMLLVISFRDEIEQREVLQLLTTDAATQGQDVRAFELGPLSETESQELARALVQAREAPGESGIAEFDAHRAQGNPFYIGQMVMGDDAHNSTDTSLDRLVARRIVGLDSAQRRVLATVAVAAGPTPVPVVLRAAAEGLGEGAGVSTASGESSAEIVALLEANLLRCSPDHVGPTLIEAAHDRIRVVAVGELSPKELRETHRAIGEAFESLGGGEFEALAEHFSHGGDAAKALDYTERAASDAAGALAFERAAQLLRRALTLVPGRAHARRRGIEFALAEQLVNLGRGAEAGAILSSLAKGAESPREARDLRRRAAGELVKAGYLDEGMDAIAPVLREVGVWHPRGVGMAILGTVFNRVLMAVRGYTFTPRAASEVPADLLERIDSLLATKTGLSHHEAIFAGYQQSQAIRLALRAGEGRRLIRCLVHDAAIFVAIGRKEKGQALLDTAREVVATIDEPEYHRVIEYVAANHRDHLGDWLGAEQAFEALQVRLDESPNSGWIRGASTVQWMFVRKLLGRYGLLRAELPERVATARDLGVRHEHVSLSALWALTQAIYGDTAAGWSLLEDLEARWHPRQVTFQTIVLATLEVEIALLEGKVARATATAERVLGNTRARIVAEMMPSHVDFYELRGRSRVRSAIAGIDVERSLSLVRSDIKRLNKSHKPQIAAQAVTITAGLHSFEGERAAAEAAWRDAADRFEAIHMHAHLAAVRMRLAALGDADLGQRAQRYFEEQGIEKVSALVDALAPAAR